MTIFKSHIRAMGAYKPPLEGRDPKQHLLLDFNERTLPVSEHVVERMVAYIRDGRMQMYPSYGDITEKIASYVGVDESQLMITNGSDQGIDLVFRASCNPGDEAIIPGPSFAMYTQCAGIENLKVLSPQYTRETGYPLREVLAGISEKTKLIVVSNPNNPCGSLLSREGIVEIAKAAPGASILVDECYFEYSNTTVVDLVNTYPNLVVTRTFSKTWGIPALRMGYVVSAPDNILALLNIRGPYDINQLAVVAVDAALQDQENVKAYINEVMEVSKPLLEAFLREKNIPFWPSTANFIWSFPDNPEHIEQILRKENILVRPKKDADGKVGLRLTLGTEQQVRSLIKLIESSLVK